MKIIYLITFPGNEVQIDVERILSKLDLTNWHCLRGYVKGSSTPGESETLIGFDIRKI